MSVLDHLHSSVDTNRLVENGNLVVYLGKNLTWVSSCVCHITRWHFFRAKLQCAICGKYGQGERKEQEEHRQFIDMGFTTKQLTLQGHVHHQMCIDNLQTTSRKCRLCVNQIKFDDIVYKLCDDESLESRVESRVESTPSQVCCQSAQSSQPVIPTQSKTQITISLFLKVDIGECFEGEDRDKDHDED